MYKHKKIKSKSIKKVKSSTIVSEVYSKEKTRECLMCKVLFHDKNFYCKECKNGRLKEILIKILTPKDCNKSFRLKFLYRTP